MFGIELQGLAAVDKIPDLRRLRPANFSKVGVETSSLHVIQAFKAHSGAGPLLGTASANSTFSSISATVSISVSFDDEENLLLKVAGKSYQLFEASVELASVEFLILLLPPNCGEVDLRTHEPKQFFAVFQDVSAQIFAQSWVIPRSR